MRTFLNEAMADKDVSVIELSAKSGISIKQIERFMADRITPSLLEASKLALALEITLDEFVHGLVPIENKLKTVDEPEMELEEALSGDEYTDAEEDETIDPKEAFMLALKANEHVNVVTTSDIFEAYRIIKNFEKLCIGHTVFVHKVKDLVDDERYYYDIYIAYEVSDNSIKYAYDMSKQKWFEKCPSVNFMINYIEEIGTLF